MSAKDQMRAMLDQLMGTARDGKHNGFLCLTIFQTISFILGDSSRYNVKFTDSKVCKSFLLGCCPHEILASTVSAP